MVQSGKFFLSPFVWEIEFDKDFVLLFNAFNYSPIKIRKDIWSDIKRGRIAGHEGVIEELVKRSFILDKSMSNVKDIAAILEFTYIKTAFLNSSLLLWLNVTSRCNFACPYCYLSKKPGHDLSISSAYKVVKFVKRELERYKGIIKNLVIVYSGGEPLLNLKTILYLHREFSTLATENGLSIHELIITNGSLLYKNILDEINTWENKVDIQVTIDGTEKSHDKLRPLKNGKGSFNIVYKNFITLVDVYAKGEIILRSNVNDENFEYVKELLQRIRTDIGFKTSKIGVDFAWIFPNQERIVELGEPFVIGEKEAKKLLILYEYASLLGFRISLTYIIRGPCIAVNAHAYVIDEFLNVYKCPGLIYTQNFFGKIGDDGELKISSIRKYLDNYVKIILGRKCFLACKYGPLCYGGCKVMKNCPRSLFKVFLPYFIRLVALHWSRGGES